MHCVLLIKGQQETPSEGIHISNSLDTSLTLDNASGFRSFQHLQGDYAKFLDRANTQLTYRLHSTEQRVFVQCSDLGLLDI